MKQWNKSSASTSDYNFIITNEPDFNKKKFLQQVEVNYGPGKLLKLRNGWKDQPLFKYFPVWGGNDLAEFTLDSEPFMVIQTKLEGERFGIFVIQGDKIGWTSFWIQDIKRDWKASLEKISNYFEEATIEDNDK